MKTNLGVLNALNPMPTTIVGATVNGKPNFIAIAWVGIAGLNRISVSLNKVHSTNPGIKENKSFSVNLPSEEIIAEADYCGIKSGKDTDKSSIFKIFYGELKTAPMIEECPINMECKLVETIDTSNHDTFIGEITATYCNEEILENKKTNINKVKPLLYSMPDRGYWRLGKRITNAWEIGNKLKK